MYYTIYGIIVNIWEMAAFKQFPAILTDQKTCGTVQENRKLKGFVQTYTHLLIGGAIGAVWFREDPAAQASLVIGSCAPDLVMVPSFLLDKVRGRVPLKEQGPAVIAMKKASHSIPLSLFFWLFPWPLQQSLGIFFAAVFLHACIDELTHGIGAAKICDESCFWPFTLEFEGLRQKIGIWEYRYGPGVLRPKPLEAFICLVLLVIWLPGLFRTTFLVASQVAQALHK